MLTSTEHEHPHDEKLCEEYRMSLTELFRFVHFTTGAVLVVLFLLLLQQWLFNILLFHVSERTPLLLCLSFLFPTHFTCMHHSNPGKDHRQSHFVFKHIMKNRHRLRKQTYTRPKKNSLGLCRRFGGARNNNPNPPLSSIINYELLLCW